MMVHAADDLDRRMLLLIDDLLMCVCECFKDMYVD